MEATEICSRFLEVCERIAGSWSLEEGFSGLMHMANTLVRPRAVAIAMPAPEQDYLKIVAARGVSAAFMNSHKIPVGDPAVQRVLVGREEVHVARVDPSDQRVAGLRLEAEDGSLIAVPIVAMHRSIGMVIAASDREDYFSEESLLVLKLVARMAAACHDRCSLYEERRHAMAVDPDTGLLSFEFFCNRMGEEIARSRRQKTPLSLLLIDIDEFLRIKQVHGSATGDEVFKAFIEQVRRTVRGIDFMGRFGLDEVLVALPETDLPGAVNAAGRVVEAVRQGRVPEAVGTVTAGAGVATLRTEENSVGPMLDRAQRGVYRATQKGKSCVCSEAEA